jgi:hypothetical protein
MKRKHILTFAAFAAAVLCTSMAQAATTPTAGDLAYNWYEIFDEILGGPIGYTIGAGGVAFGLGAGIFGSNIKVPIITTALSAAFLGVNTIVSTMGAIY